MRALLKAFFIILQRLLGKKNFEKLLVFGLKANDTDLYPHALIQKGFSGWSNYQHTGELNILHQIKNSAAIHTCFDIGANDGSYSIMLINVFTGAKVFAFEPVASIYDTAVSKIKDHAGITLINKAVSNYAGTMELYTDSSSNNNQISSSFADGLKDFYQVNDLQKLSVDVVTIDSFCQDNNISRIDFLKVDVEGAELSVLQGCAHLLSTNGIGFIQFEFNDFNISSRTFVKDFYDLLRNFRFYRVTKNGCIALGEYTASHEIFRYQNILAVHASMPFNG